MIDDGNEAKKDIGFSKREAGRKTIGELSLELSQKELETDDPVEMQQAMQYKTFEKEFYDALERGKKKYLTDFYIVVINQRFRLFSNVIRAYFLDRMSCPTPDFDQSVYKIDIKEGEIEFLWTIPDKNTAYDMYLNAVMVDPEQRELLKYVLDFYDGSLLEKTKKLNKENEQSLVLIS